MWTILLEVKNESQLRLKFYNPASEGFKKHPRTEKGISKAIQELSAKARENDWISDYRFVVYEGNFKHYKKHMKPWLIIDKTGELTQ